MSMLPRLVSIVRDDDADPPLNLKGRRLPVVVDDMRTLIADMDDACTLADVRGATHVPGGVPPAPMSLKVFFSKVQRLRECGELKQALTIDEDQFSSYVAQLVPCVGCRRCVEKLFGDIGVFNYEALDPFKVVAQDDDDIIELTVDPSLLNDDKRLHRYLIANHGKCRYILDTLTKTKKGNSNKRCQLHMLETHSCKAGSCSSWSELWSIMSTECRDECGIVEADSLYEMLESYLRKHRFCPECKNKLTRAYQCLTGGVDTSKERGYNAKLYSGLRYCKEGEHLHVKGCVNYMDTLIERAQVELNGSTRERHAKTLEIGQVEVLTCLGLYLHGRLHRLNASVRVMQNSYQLLYCTTVIALAANFQSYVESKEGLLSESFERLCAELQLSTANPNEKSKRNKQRKKNKALKSKSETPPPVLATNGIRNENVDVDQVCVGCTTKPCACSPRQKKSGTARQSSTSPSGYLANRVASLHIKTNKKNDNQQQQQQHKHHPITDATKRNSTNTDQRRPMTPPLVKLEKFADDAASRRSLSPLTTQQTNSTSTNMSPTSNDHVTMSEMSPLYPHRRIRRAARRLGNNNNSSTPNGHITANQQLHRDDDADEIDLIVSSSAARKSSSVLTSLSATSTPSDLGYESSRDTSPNTNTSSSISSSAQESPMKHAPTKSIQFESLHQIVESDEPKQRYEDKQSQQQHVGSPHISESTIEWMEQNKNAVLEQRQQLRKRVWEKFHAMQSRLAAR